MAFEHVNPGDRFAPPTAFEHNAMLDAGRAILAGKTGLSPGSQGLLSPQSCTLRVINKTGAARERYECVSLGDPSWDLDEKHNIRNIVIEADAADPDKPIAILQEPLNTDRVGLAVVSGPSLLRFDTFAAVKNFAIAKTNHKLDVSDSGPIRVIKAVSNSYGIGVLGAGGGGGSSNLVQTTGTIAQNASGTCTIYRIISGTPTSQSDTISVLNPWPFTIPSGMRILANQDTYGDWYAVHPGITNVRWIDPDLEQTLDGTTYTNIDTAVTCP